MPAAASCRPFGLMNVIQYSTPAGLSSDTLSADAGALAASALALVEAQHRISTLKLVDSVDEQETLEDLIRRSSRQCRPSASICTSPVERFATARLIPSAPTSGGSLTDASSTPANRPEIAVRNGIPSPALLCRSPARRAGEPRGIHGVFRGVCDQKGITLQGRYVKTKGRDAPDDYAPCQAFADIREPAKIESFATGRFAIRSKE